ncbi:MAG: glycoside hydrolase family 2 protein [Leptothrix sp. (in: b-proteobacteria)]
MPRAVHRQPLHAGWQFRVADAALGTAESFAGDAGWCAASVPGTVYQDLIAHGAIPDPWIGRNEADVQWVAERDWCYRLTFEVSAEAARDTLALVFDGLDTFAQVWLDGACIATSDNLFVPLRVDVSGRLNPGPHTLAIRFDSALRRGREIEAHHGARPLWNGDSSRLFVRKAPYHYGWDWGPTLLTAGPGQGIRLEAHDLRIAEVASPVWLADDLGRARVDVQTTLDGRLAAGTLIQHQLIDADGAVVADHAGPARQAHAVSLNVAAPQLWWPAGCGAQPLYTLRTQLIAADGRVIDTHERRLGLRRLRLVQAPVADLGGGARGPEPGRSFVFEVNGVELFAGGANWIPDDNLLNRITPARYRQRVQQAVEANLVMLRVWGGGIYETDDFYDACDALGVLVWQDFVFACGLYPAHPAFVASVEAEARAAITRLRHRASLALWCGNNEDHMLAEAVGAYGPSGAPGVELMRFEARAIYEQLLPTLCGALDPGRPYWPGSPYTASTEVIPPNGATPTGSGPRPSQDPSAGDRHSWEVWHQQMLPYQRYGEVGARFVSEFGMQSHPSLAVLEACLPPEERFVGSRTLQWHNKAFSPVGPDGHRRLAVYRADNLPPSVSLADEVYATQFIQAEALRHAYEAFRRRWQRPGARACGGALVWQLNDCWPVTSWAIVDSAGRPKPAWYAVRRAMAPLAVAVRRDLPGGLAGPSSTCAAWAMTGLQAWAGRARWTLHTVDGDCIDQLDAPLALDANTSTELAPPPSWFAEPDRPLIATLALHGNADHAHHAGRDARSSAWPEPLRWHRLADPQIRATVEADGLGGHALVLQAAHPAKGVWVEAAAGALADNFVDLLPGVPLKLALHGDAAALGTPVIRHLQALQGPLG